MTPEGNGIYRMDGIPWNEPGCIHTADEAIKYINNVGFLPLFSNSVPGFSLEEHTGIDYWWSEDIERDPWEWRIEIARTGEVAYGKFFSKKAGFVSKEWLPYFVNYRRDGYDFEGKYSDGLASYQEKNIMDLFSDENCDMEYFSPELKSLSHFQGSRSKFDSVIQNLMMEFYLVTKDFQRRVNKKGEEYGWSIAVYCTPEHLFGDELVYSAYKEEPTESFTRILEHMKELYPEAKEKDIIRVIK